MSADFDSDFESTDSRCPEFESSDFESTDSDLTDHQSDDLNLI